MRARTVVTPILAMLLSVPTSVQALEKVATGFGFVEGPAWNLLVQDLVSSDIANNEVMRFGAKDKVPLFLAESDQANGLVYDQNVDLYACLGGAREVVRIHSEGKRTVLAREFNGKKLNSPSDLALDDDGGLYFTDPRDGKLAVGAGRQPTDTNHSDSVHYLLAPEDRAQPWRAIALPHEPTVHRMRFVRDARGHFDLVVAAGQATHDLRFYFHRTFQ